MKSSKFYQIFKRLKRKFAYFCVGCRALTTICRTGRFLLAKATVFQYIRAVIRIIYCVDKGKAMTYWLAAAALLFAAEMFLGTVYLLVLSLALVGGALAAISEFSK